MAVDSQVKLKIGADTSDIEAQFSKLIKKIQSEADKLKIGGGAATKPQASGELAAVAKQSRDLDKRIRDEKTGLEIINRELAKKKALVEDIARKQEAAVKGSQQELWHAQNLVREKEKLNKTQQMAQIQQANFRRAEEAAARASGAAAAAGGGGGTAGGGLNIPTGGITSVRGAASALGVPGMVIGGLATAVAAALGIEKLRVMFSQTDNRARVAGASAFQTEGQAGQRLNSFLNGGAVEDMMFSGQRAQGAAIAEETMRNNLAERNRAGRLLTHPMEAVQAFGKDIGIDFGLGKEISEKQKLEQAEIQKEQTEALKNGPDQAVRTALAQKYAREWRGNLDFQRQTGQSEEGFRKFLGSVNSAGFDNQQAMSMSSAIMGAGGSTRAATQNAGFALQMGRQFDLTNAGQAIGTLSSQLGSGSMSKEALIKIQAEGTRIGLNQADFVGENRKFVEMASSVLAQSNVSSGAGVDQVLETLTRFMGNSKTMAGMEAGKSAYEAYQQMSNTQSGPQAVMRMGGMRKDSVLGGLGERSRAALSLLNESQITTDSDLIYSMSHGGTAPGDITSHMKKVIGESQFVNPATDKAISNLKKAYEDSKKPVRTRAESDVQQMRLRQARGEAENAVLLESPQGTTEKQAGAMVDALSRGDSEGFAKLQKDIAKQVDQNKNVRPGDEAEKQQGEAARMANEMFISIKDSIQPAVEETAKFTAKINDLVAAMNSHNSSAIRRAQDAFGPGGIPGLAPSNQTSVQTGGSGYSGPAPGSG